MECAGRAQRRRRFRARLYRRFPNLLYRRFPNRQNVRVPGVPVGGAACGLGNPRNSRLGNLRYQKGRSVPAVAIEIQRCV